VIPEWLAAANIGDETEFGRLIHKWDEPNNHWEMIVVTFPTVRDDLVVFQKEYGEESGETKIEMFVLTRAQLGLAFGALPR
jgi:hypothetical protein